MDRTLARLSAEEPIDVIPTANLLELLEAAAITDHREAATALRPALDGLEELCAFGHSASGMCVARHPGAVATILGGPEKARVYFRKAIEVCERIRFRPELALTRLQLAELLLEIPHGGRAYSDAPRAFGHTAAR